MEWTAIVTGLASVATTIGAIWKLSSNLEERFVKMESSINRIDNDLKEIKSDVKEIKSQANRISERVSHLEGGFEERGRSEFIKLVKKE